MNDLKEENKKLNKMKIADSVVSSISILEEFYNLKKLSTPPKAALIDSVQNGLSYRHRPVNIDLAMKKYLEAFHDIHTQFNTYSTNIDIV